MKRFLILVFCGGVVTSGLFHVLNAQSVPVAGSSVLSGSVSVTATEAALPNHAVRQVCIETLSAVTVYLGTTGVTSSNGYNLTGPAQVCLNVNNTAAVHIVAGGNVTATWIATTN